jgi:hypothetical protein
MQADFLDAHERHWSDADRLFSAGRYANADHLYGIAAECGLKRLMVRFGMVVNPATGSPTDSKDWKHANNMWDRFESYRSGKVEGVDYGLPMPNPFGNWDVSDRYAHQSNFSQAGVQLHQAGAAAICELIKKAQREGLLV